MPPCGNCHECSRIRLPQKTWFFALTTTMATFGRYPSRPASRYPKFGCPILHKSTALLGQSGPRSRGTQRASRARRAEQRNSMGARSRRYGARAADRVAAIGAPWRAMTRPSRNRGAAAVRRHTSIAPRISPARMANDARERETFRRRREHARRMRPSRISATATRSRSRRNGEQMTCAGRMTDVLTPITSPFASTEGPTDYPD